MNLNKKNIYIKIYLLSILNFFLKKDYEIKYFTSV